MEGQALMAKVADQDPVRPASLAFRNAATGDAIIVDSSNPIPTTRADGAAVSFTNGSALNAVLFSTSTSGYGGVAVQLTGAWTATVTFQSSMDSINWNTVESVALGGGIGATSATGAGQFWISGHALYVRALLTAYTSGTVAGTAVLRAATIDPIATSVTVAASTNAIGGVYPTLGATSANGTPALSGTRITSAASTNATSVKGTAGRVCGGHLTNTTASLKHVHFYSLATAPTVGSSTVTLTVAIPPNSAVPLEPIVGVGGLFLAAGIALSITGGFADSDTTAVAAGDVLISLLYL